MAGAGTEKEEEAAAWNGSCRHTSYASLPGPGPRVGRRKSLYTSLTSVPAEAACRRGMRYNSYTLVCRSCAVLLCTQSTNEVKHK